MAYLSLFPLDGTVAVSFYLLHCSHHFSQFCEISLVDDSYFTDEVILWEVDEFSKDCHNNWEAVTGGVFFCQQESIVVRYDFTLVHARLPLI